MRLFILLLPWLELFTLIELGIRTSALTALAWVLATLLLGLALLQRQGRDLFDSPVSRPPRCCRPSAAPPARLIRASLPKEWRLKSRRSSWSPCRD